MPNANIRANTITEKDTGRVVQIDSLVDDINGVQVTTSTGEQALAEALDERSAILTSSLTANIPSDYATLQEAIDDLSVLSVKRGVEINLRIESGHQPSSGFSVSHGDYSHFRISSADSSVVVDSGWPSGESFMIAENCSAPVIDLLVDMDGLGGRGLQYISASTGVITSGSGVINATGDGPNTAGIYVLNSTVTARNVTATNNGRGFWITRGANVDAEGADASDATTIGLYVSRGSGAEFASGKATNCGTVGVVSNRSHVSAPLAVVDGCDRGFQSENTGTIAARGASALNCTTAGVRAVDLGVVQARDVDTTGSGQGFAVGTGGLIDRTGGTGTQNLTENNWWKRFGCIIDNGAADYSP